MLLRGDVPPSVQPGSTVDPCIVLLVEWVGASACLLGGDHHWIIVRKLDDDDLVVKDKEHL